jgi:hypothetical protein
MKKLDYGIEDYEFGSCCSRKRKAKSNTDADPQRNPLSSGEDR